MNYNSLDSMLNTKKNMEVLRNNSKVDTGTDIVKGVDWFKFNNVIAKNIYVNSDSWIGFGSSTQHLKICYRDGAIWNLYREEGTLYNYYKFLKIRWEGYSYYGSTAIDYKLVWELFIFDNGDMFINVVNVPTKSSYLGTSTILSSGNNITLDIELGTPTFISLYHDDENGVAWTVKKELLDIPCPFDIKYLVRCDGKYYTLIDGILSEISVDTLNAEIFKNKGFNKPESFDFLKDLSNPDLLNWISTDIYIGNIELNVTATPFDQILETKSFNMTDPSILGIDNIITDSEVLFKFSFDAGVTYEVFKDNIWINANDEWMTNDEVISLTNENFDIKNPIEYIIKFKIADTGYLKNIVVNYKNGV